MVGFVIELVLKLKVNGPKKNAKNQTINTDHALLEGTEGQVNSRSYLLSDF